MQNSWVRVAIILLDFQMRKKTTVGGGNKIFQMVFKNGFELKDLLTLTPESMVQFIYQGLQLEGD